MRDGGAAEMQQVFVELTPQHEFVVHVVAHPSGMLVKRALRNLACMELHPKPPTLLQLILISDAWEFVWRGFTRSLTLEWHLPLRDSEAGRRKVAGQAVSRYQEGVALWGKETRSGL